MFSFGTMIGLMMTTGFTSIKMGLGAPLPIGPRRSRGTGGPDPSEAGFKLAGFADTASGHKRLLETLERRASEEKEERFSRLENEGQTLNSTTLELIFEIQLQYPRQDLQAGFLNTVKLDRNVVNLNTVLPATGIDFPSMAPYKAVNSWP